MRFVYYLEVVREILSPEFYSLQKGYHGDGTRYFLVAKIDTEAPE